MLFRSNHVCAREGIDDDLARGEAYVRHLSADHPDLLDEQALHRWLQASPEALDYWERVGAIRWEIIPDLADYYADAPGALEVGRYLTNAPIDGSELGDWRPLLRVSPAFPVGMTYAEMNVKGRRSSLAETQQSAAVAGGEDDEIAGHAGVPAFGRSDAAPAEARTGDPLTFGTGVVASFLARAAREQAIEIRLEIGRAHD